MTGMGSLTNIINLPGGPGDTTNCFSLNWPIVPGNPKILNARVYDVVLDAGEVATDYTNFLNRLNPTPPPYVGSVGGRRFGGRFAG